MKLPVSHLGLNLCGFLSDCRAEETPIVVTTRREVTHVIIPVLDATEAEEILSQHARRSSKSATPMRCTPRPGGNT